LTPCCLTRLRLALTQTKLAAFNWNDPGTQCFGGDSIVSTNIDLLISS
jgi:hypothetical protein